MGIVVSRSYFERRKSGDQRKLRIFGVIVFLAGFLGCSIQEETPSAVNLSRLPDISQAQGYRILGVESYPAPRDRGRYRIVIYSENAKTRDQRAQTAIKAAIDLQRRSEVKAYEILVWLEALPQISERLAIVDYHPYKVSAWGDEKEHIWSVDASDYQVLGGEINSLEVILSEYLRE